MDKHINAQSSPLKNENGSAIIAAIFILVVVTLLGITATNTSTLELQIASNDQFIKMAFYNSDSAVYGTSKLISHALNRSEPIGTVSDASGVTYLPTSASNPDVDFYNQIAGYNEYDSSPDIDFAPGIDSQADARRDRQQHMAGGGAEFATGAEGVGPSAIGIFYDVNTTGFSNRQTTSNLTASYRKMVGIPGGL